MTIRKYSYRPSWMQPIEARNPSKLIEENELRGRGVFNRDLGTIVHSNFFKRLSHKTQVYSLPFNDHIRTRLTHSVEAHQIGRQIARYFCKQVVGRILTGDDYYRFANELEELTGAACLAHDIGHSAFGHTGHSVISRFCKLKDERFVFDDNKQVVRIFLNHNWIEKFSPSGPFLASILKKVNLNENCYPGDQKPLRKVLRTLKLLGLRHPASIFMEAADDIAYLSSDMHDFIASYSGDKSFEDLPSRFRSFSKLICLDGNGKESKKNLMHYFMLALSQPSEDHIQDFSDNFLRIALDHTFKVIDSFRNTFMVQESPTTELIPRELTCFLIEHSISLKNGKKESSILYSSAGDFRGKVLLGLKSKMYGDLILREPFIDEQDKLAEVVLTSILEELYKFTLVANPKKTETFQRLPESIKQYFILAIASGNLFPAIIDFVSGMTDRYAISFWKEIIGLSALDRLQGKKSA